MLREDLGHLGCPFKAGIALSADGLNLLMRLRVYDL